MLYSFLILLIRILLLLTKQSVGVVYATHCCIIVAKVELRCGSNELVTWSESAMKTAWSLFTLALLLCACDRSSAQQPRRPEFSETFLSKVQGLRGGYFMHTMFCRLDPVLSLSLMANERHRVETVHSELLYIDTRMMLYRVQVL